MDFIAQIVGRSLGEGQALRPRPPALFEPAEPEHPEPPGSTDAPDDRGSVPGTAPARGGPRPSRERADGHVADHLTRTVRRGRDESVVLRPRPPAVFEPSDSEHRVLLGGTGTPDDAALPTATARVGPAAGRAIGPAREPRGPRPQAGDGRAVRPHTSDAVDTVGSPTRESAPGRQAPVTAVTGDRPSGPAPGPTRSSGPVRPSPEAASWVPTPVDATPPHRRPFPPLRPEDPPGAGSQVVAAAEPPRPDRRETRSIAAARSAASAAVSPSVSAAAPTITVTIGRVEVRATTTAAPSPPPRPQPVVMSLDEYLRQRGGGSAG